MSVFKQENLNCLNFAVDFYFTFHHVTPTHAMCSQFNSKSKYQRVWVTYSMSYF